MSPEPAALRLLQRMAEFYTPERLGDFCDASAVAEGQLYEDLEKALNKRDAAALDTLTEELKYAVKIRNNICIRVPQRLPSVQTV